MRACLLAVLALALTAAPAQAGWKLDRATAIAQVVFAPGCGPVTVTLAASPDDGEDEWGHAYTGDCNITVDPEIARSWVTFCDTVLHETGHVVGLGHSENPRSVMADFNLIVENGFWDARTGKVRFETVGADPRCAKRGRPYLRKHGLL